MKTFHKIKRFIIILITTCLLFLISVISWYKFAWPRYIDRTEISKLCDEINTSDSLPANFYEVYDKIYPGHRQTSLSKTMWVGGLNMIINKELPRELISPTKYISNLFHLTNHTENKLRILKDYSIYFTFAINKYTSPEKCFDYYIKHFDFLYNTIGYEAACQRYFDKEFNELTNDEIIGLIVMLKNPALFNPRRFPDRYKKEINKMKEKIK